MFICPNKEKFFLKDRETMINNLRILYRSMPSQNNNIHFQLWKNKADDYYIIARRWYKKWRRWIILFEHKDMILKYNNHLKKLKRRRKEIRSSRINLMRRRNLMRKRNRIRRRNRMSNRN